MNAPAAQPARSLIVLALTYGAMVPLAGVLGAKQVALGPLAVEAGIFPFLLLVAISSTVAELYGPAVARALVRWGFGVLILAIALTLSVLALPTDPAMYRPAQTAFPVILGQSWRMMGAGLISYGISVNLNVWVFGRLAGAARAPIRGAISAALSQIIDTMLFITISFYGVRPIATLMAGQMLAKLVLSAVMVPFVITLALRAARRLDATP